MGWSRRNPNVLDMFYGSWLTVERRRPLPHTDAEEPRRPCHGYTNPRIEGAVEFMNVTASKVTDLATATDAARIREGCASG